LRPNGESSDFQCKQGFWGARRLASIRQVTEYGQRNWSQQVVTTNDYWENLMAAPVRC
jgi:hypothetical protein